MTITKPKSNFMTTGIFRRTNKKLARVEKIRGWGRAEAIERLAKRECDAIDAEKRQTAAGGTMAEFSSP